ncbi:MAG: hypothetical protein SNH73_01075 [Rikenellaceae bacterium]
MSSEARYYKIIRSVVICLASCVLFSGCGIARDALLMQPSQREFQRNYTHLTGEKIEELRQEFGNNKIFVEEYIEATLIALSFYPELLDSPIEFKYSKEATTMAARPQPGSMLFKRRYVVVINNDPAFEGVKLSDVPFNAQIGIIGHELAHIADYEQHNLFGVVGILFRYGSKARKPLFEKEIDLATIERGLGWQLFDWAQFSLDEQNGATEEYRKFKEENYLSPDQIKQYIEFFARYGRAGQTHEK